ncbi:hypothetical protein L6164_003878 [Bauhinia variegata]|uniref:Uncharacterized protein n=1 Tax=Bauhinia variegata TaxID=167791 RepID=A0ACB9Q5D3_BAUVA|nr:hypothetical protein L6164_003878 [Bauhinia variegata]
MASWGQKHEKMPKNLKTQLAVAVRSIQWSYGIFWSYSAGKEGTLEWGDGYYNGDIKTRKTVKAMELKPDKIGLQRSEQLRELYKFLHEGETDPQTKRPSAALSPEDLTDLEWYYLVCMSFVFKPNESFPVSALESGETMWLCNAQYADSKVFSRSLLAKSASIQTVACFPYLGGVIEIGTTELVQEDLNLVQHVKACFLDFSKPTCYGKCSSDLNKEDDNKGPKCTKIENGISCTMALENLCSPAEEIKFDQDPIKDLKEDTNEDFNMDSLDECFNDCEHHCQVEDSMFEGVNDDASQVNSLQLVDDNLSSGAQDSLASGDCISDAFKNKDETYKSLSKIQLGELQDCNHSKLSSLCIGADEDLHYTRTLSSLLGNSSVFKESYTSKSGYKSSFIRWNIGGILDLPRPRLSQSMLKNILFNVPLMHSSFSSPKSQKEDEKIGLPGKLGNKDNCTGNVLSDKRKETENFQVLKSMVPSVNEVDQISILSYTIKYLKELEARVEELESCMDNADSKARTRRKNPDVLEQISDNYDNRKRKAFDIDEPETEPNRVAPKEGIPLDVKVNMKEQEVLIEMKCPYREYILLDIMDAINNLHLDAHTVQSSTEDGVLILTLKSKFRGAAIAPLGMIKEALWKVSGKI